MRQKKKIMITGAAKRIGRFIALHLAASKDVELILHYYNTSTVAINRLSSEINKLSGSIPFTVKANFNHMRSVHECVLKVLEYSPDIDVLIHCASVYQHQDFYSLSEEDWDLNMNINLKSIFFLSQRLMFQDAAQTKNKNKKIINFIDSAIVNNEINRDAGFTSYTVSKYGLLGLTHSLARAFYPYVQVNGIAPGNILPPLSLEQSNMDNIEPMSPSVEDILHVVDMLLKTKFITNTIVTVSDHIV